MGLLADYGPVQTAWIRLIVTYNMGMRLDLLFDIDSRYIARSLSGSVGASWSRRALVFVVLQVAESWSGFWAQRLLFGLTFGFLGTCSSPHHASFFSVDFVCESLTSTARPNRDKQGRQFRRTLRSMEQRVREQFIIGNPMGSYNASKSNNQDSLMMHNGIETFNAPSRSCTVNQTCCFFSSHADLSQAIHEQPLESPRGHGRLKKLFVRVSRLCRGKR
ncbi:hypothetical protein ACRALDRAFT_1091378 [Sodiomyces alcalophilus JCM 7366]|uniref:uncharacterized protein n=1 Tax=Sodiomyces alcalophilus JCM 7366 TaxID=591952 RepID=UPI0039B4A2B8